MYYVIQFGWHAFFDVIGILEWGFLLKHKGNKKKKYEMDPNINYLPTYAMIIALMHQCTAHILSVCDKAM